MFRHFFYLGMARQLGACGAGDFFTTEDTKVFSQRRTERSLCFFAFEGHRARLRRGRGQDLPSSGLRSKLLCVP